MRVFVYSPYPVARTALWKKFVKNKFLFFIAEIVLLRFFETNLTLNILIWNKLAERRKFMVQHIIFDNFKMDSTTIEAKESILETSTVILLEEFEFLLVTSRWKILLHD